MRIRRMKQIVSLLLAALLVVGNLPITGLAEEAETESGANCSTNGCTLAYGHEGECNNQAPTQCTTEGCTLGYGHEGECNNQAPTQCTTEGCTLGYGHEGECNNQAPTQCTTEGCTLGYGHEGECNNQTPTQCTTEGCALGYGHEGECNSLQLLSDDAENAAQPITVYVSVTIKGELQKATDGTFMAYREVLVDDTDKDGIISLDDVMRCTHIHYFNGTDENIGYAPAVEGQKGFSTFWGKSPADWGVQRFLLHVIDYGAKANGGTTKTDTSIDVKTFEVHDGQYISVSSVSTNSPGAGMFASYGKTPSTTYFLSDVIVPTNKEFQLSLCYKKTTGSPTRLENYNIYVIDKSGMDVSQLYTLDGQPVITKKNGNLSTAIFNVSFSQAGTYTLITKPTEKNDVYGAAVIRIHVYDNSPISVMEAKVGISNTLENDTVTFDSDVKDYRMVIPETCNYIYGSVEYNSSEEVSNYIATKIEICKDSTWSGIIGPSEASGKSNAALKSELLSDSVWKARLVVEDKYVTNAAFGEYTIDIMRKPLLNGIATDLVLTEKFSPDINSYVAFIDPTAETFSITPSVSKTTHIAKINNSDAIINSANSIDVASLEFDNEGKAELQIALSDSDERYTENTYVFTIYKAPTNDTPSFVGEMENAYYIIGDAAKELSVLASASGKISYQWYSNTTNSAENAVPLDGQTSNTLTPPTTQAGETYYFCKATNESTSDSAFSNIVLVKVYPDPTPRIAWKTEIPQFSEEQLAYLQAKHPTGALPDAAKNGDNYYGFYYRANDETITSLTVNAISDASDGELVCYWSYSQPIGGGSSVNFYKGESYTPDTSTANGARVYNVRASYTLLGKTYWSDYIYVYVFTDEALGTYPSDITWAGTGTETAPWLLTNQADLEQLRSFVNYGYTFANTYLAFGNDITLDTSWKGIGDGDGYGSKGENFKPFSGTLDGNGHTLTYEKGGQYPLFNYVREATVKNLEIYAPYIANYGLVSTYVVDYGADGNYNIGTGGSYAEGCPDTIDIIGVTIKSGSIIMKSGFIGGGASGGNTVNIIGCTVQENVKIGCYEDGSSADQPLIGSFAGSISGSVTNCTSYADVYGSNSVAGIVAGKSQAMGYFNINNNAFLGNIQASGNYVGGIVASGYSADSAPNAPCVSIVNCYVVGNITGKNYVGGIFGGEPGVVQTWANGIGNIQNNFFYGTVKATGGNYAGGIVGYMKSLNVYNCIENNYYLDSCGAKQAIGGVQLIDTSSAAQHPTWVGNTYYINSAVDNLKAVDYELFGNNNYEYVKNPNHNRSDDPLGKDADKLGTGMTAESFADGTVTLLLNEHSTSYKNWGQGQRYPTFNGKKIVVKLESSGTYKTEYTVGDRLNLSGIVLTATWSDGSVTNPKLTEATVSGFDSSVHGEQEITITYQNSSTTITVLVKQKTGVIDVKISVLGDSAHNSDSDGQVHTLSNGGLTTWIEAVTYTVDSNSTVKSVLEKALADHGMTCYNPSGNYVVSINGLGEFTNGKNSGWMYTLNGSHPSLGVAQQYLSNGDVIVFHYTDDYTKEEGSVTPPTQDTVTAQTVIDLINKIGTVTYTDECKQKIDAARKAFDALSPDEQKKVTNQSKLTEAEKKYEELKLADDKAEARKVDDLISKIGTVTANSGAAITAAWDGYYGLSVAQKSYVTKLSVLQEATRKWNQLKADEVIKLIDKIGEPITEKSKASIEAARKAYDALTKDQKNLVTNATKLTDAEKAYAQLTATPEDKEKAQKVIDLIKKLTNVTLDSEKDIQVARKAYDALTDLQKLLVDNYDVLTTAETKLAMLKAMGKVSDPYISTGDYMEKLGTPGIGSIGGEWMVIGLARSGRTVPGVEDYYKKALEYIESSIDPKTGRLHNAKSTENSRMIMALTAIGKDVTNVGGYNLLQGLSDLEYVTYQGSNGTIWALLALDAGNYPAPAGGTTTRQALIEELLRVQTSDGGWAFAGDKADSDMTGMALTALAPYYKKDLRVQQAIDKAVARLSEMQDADGGFWTFDTEGNKVTTSESISQVITALSALGINPDTDERFIKNGSSAIDALLRYYVTGGGFKHVMDGEIDGMATEQAYYALTAYYRFLSGKTNLYDMTDIINMGGDPVELTTEPTVPATTEPAQVEQTKAGYPWWILVICIFGGCGWGVAIMLIIPKLKKKKD